jgi:hypothetical protein
VRIDAPPPEVFLRERRDGTRRLYALRPEASEAVRAFLDELWPASLSRLKATVD